jgi:hypothetical protein
MNRHPGRTRSRRIEIALGPNLHEPVRLPGAERAALAASTSNVVL